MMKTKRLLLGASMCAAMFAFGGCQNDDDLVPVEQNESIESQIEKAFDYNMVGAIPVTMSYPGISIVNVYDKLPEEGDARLLYTAVTDYKGQFKGTAYIPKEYIGKTVYAIETMNPESPYLTEAVVKADGLSITASANTRAVLEPDRTNIEAGIQWGVLSYLPDKKNNTEFINDKFETRNIDIELKEDANVKVTFVSAGGEYKEALYYYVYKKGNKPSKDEIENGIKNKENKIFEGINQQSSKNNIGKTWQIYQNGSNNINLKAGQMIGFVLKTNNGNDYYYTTDAKYNDDKKVHAARFNYKEKALIFTFEDMPVGGKYQTNNGKYGDYDYNDVIIMVTADPIQAITDPDDPIINNPPYEIEVYSEYQQGTVLFEDLYPEQGDYDMNDFVVSYSMRVRMSVLYNPATGSEIPPYYLEALECKFIPRWDGAEYGQKFMFRFGKDANTTIFDQIITIPETFVYELPADKYMGNLDDVEPIEKEISLGKREIQQPIDFNWNLFDPYIKVSDTNYEVHLTKKYPTEGANADVTDRFLKLFINEGNYPFAMCIPTLEYGITEERVRIDKYYPSYIKWVESNGKEATDWYNYPKQ